MILELQHYLHSILVKIPTVNSPKRLQKHPQLTAVLRITFAALISDLRYIRITRICVMYIYNVSYNYNVVGHA